MAHAPVTFGIYAGHGREQTSIGEGVIFSGGAVAVIWVSGAQVFYPSFAAFRSIELVRWKAQVEAGFTTVLYNPPDDIAERLR